MKTQLDADDWRNEGNECFNGRSYRKAILCYTKALELSPNDETLYSNRAVAYLKNGNLELALQDAIKCTTLKPDWVKGYFRLGTVYFELKKYELAKSALERALSLDPTSEEIKSKLEQIEQYLLNPPISLCDQCGKPATTKLICGKCMTAIYCSKQCQTKHWPKHKHTCVKKE